MWQYDQEYYGHGGVLGGGHGDGVDGVRCGCVAVTMGLLICDYGV